MKSEAVKTVIRTCVCCGKKEEKKNLNRFVWNKTEPVIDEKQNKDGRGAYCCKNDSCSTQFFKQNKKWMRYFRLYR